MFSGGVPEWLIGTVLKTVDRFRLSVGLNPTPSAFMTNDHNPDRTSSPARSAGQASRLALFCISKSEFIESRPLLKNTLRPIRIGFVRRFFRTGYCLTQDPLATVPTHHPASGDTRMRSLAHWTTSSQLLPNYQKRTGPHADGRSLFIQYDTEPSEKFGKNHPFTARFRG